VHFAATIRHPVRYRFQTGEVCCESVNSGKR
jgi:hypothetical protein